ncbi:MAG: RNA-binding protein [Clostridiales bacterium]|nr:RNA-binding protein [Clostridiales bacterium]
MDISGLEKWHFEVTQSACDHLLELVLEGKKRATSSSLPAYEIEGEPLPEEGSMSVITGWDGIPKCVIRTTRVQVLPFRDITFDTAVLEGEDECLATWRGRHEKFFREEGMELGYTFTEDMPVVFEEFEIAEKL